MKDYFTILNDQLVTLSLEEYMRLQLKQTAVLCLRWLMNDERAELYRLVERGEAYYYDGMFSRHPFN